MTKLKTIMLLVTGIFLTTQLAAQSYMADDIEGIWFNEEKDAKVRIYEENGQYFGKVIWLEEPNEPDTGEPKLDDENSDPELQKRPIMGLLLMKDFVFDGDDVPCIDCQFVRSFYENENGRLFFIADAGIYYFENDSFHRVKKTEEYSFYWPVNSSFEDSKDNLWLGAPARVYHYNGQKWRSFNRKNGLPSTDNPPYGFTETSENKIIMTAKNGLYYYDNEGLWEKEKMKLLTSNSYVDNQDRHWIPALKGLIIRDGDKESLHKDIPWVWRVIEDKAGGIWALSKNKGAKRLKDGKWQLFNEDNQLPSDKVVMFYVSKSGTVWLGTNKGICSCEYE